MSFCVLWHLVPSSRVLLKRFVSRSFRRTGSLGLPFLACLGLALSAAHGFAQAPLNSPGTSAAPGKAGDLGVQTPGQKNGGTTRSPASTGAEAGQAGEQGGTSKSASGTPTGLSSTAPSVPPPAPAGRRRIGVAMGGGGALAMSEIGALQWFEEHHIPVDVIAGTSMGCMVSALYASGKTIDNLKVVMNNQVFTNVFRISTDFRNRNYRRREDAREVPNAVNIGLKHGVSFRNSVLLDAGLNSFLDREFLRFDDQTDFNTMPIPFRCLSTDLNEARTVTFARGSIPDAVRASVSIPGVYSPFELGGHEFVDGAVLENLPSQTVRDMNADAVIAVSLPLAPVGKGDLDSILGVLQRSFGVAIEGNERASRKLADVVIEPNLDGYSAGDYLKTDLLAIRGYEAAEKQKALLLPYAVDDAQWQEYLAERASRMRGPARTVLAVRVKAPNASATAAAEELFRPLVNQQVDTKRVEALLADLRSDGRYDADYTVGYEEKGDHRPILLVTVQEKKTGPPFLQVGANVAAQTGGTSRATLEATLLNQDLGGFGSELRSHVTLGYVTDLDTEYYRKLPRFLGGNLSGPSGGTFVAPRFGFVRQPFPIYQGDSLVAERVLQTTGGGVDAGWGNGRKLEFRAGWQKNDIRWHERIGIADGLPDVYGSMQMARTRLAFDSQDKALVPQFGERVTVEAGYLYNAAGGVNAPRFDTQIGIAHGFRKEVFVFGADAGTMLNRNVGQPYRFTLGGPLRLSASGLDQYRGTDFFLVQPGMLRKVASLPAILGQSIYVGGVYEAGQMRAPDQRTVTRQDVFLGLLVETPLGLITIGPAIGDGGQHRLVFTLSKLF